MACLALKSYAFSPLEEAQQKAFAQLDVGSSSTVVQDLLRFRLYSRSAWEQWAQVGRLFDPETNEDEGVVDDLATLATSLPQQVDLSLADELLEQAHLALSEGAKQLQISGLPEKESFEYKFVCDKMTEFTEVEEDFKNATEATFVRDDRFNVLKSIAQKSGFLESLDSGVSNADGLFVSQTGAQVRSDKNKFGSYIKKTGHACTSWAIFIRAVITIIPDPEKVATQTAFETEWRRWQAQYQAHKTQELRGQIERVVKTLLNLAQHDFTMMEEVSQVQASDEISDKVLDNTVDIDFQFGIRMKPFIEKLAPLYWNGGEILRRTHLKHSDAVQYVDDLGQQIRMDINELVNYYRQKKEAPEVKANSYYFHQLAKVLRALERESEEFYFRVHETPVKILTNENGDYRIWRSRLNGVLSHSPSWVVPHVLGFTKENRKSYNDARKSFEQEHGKFNPEEGVK